MILAARRCAAQTQLGLIRALTNHRPEYAVISYTCADARLHCQIAGDEEA